MSFTPPGLNSYLGFLFWHLWMTLPLCARWTPALMWHLTNPCAKRKVLILTKLKGKIYKTKSLRHYITSIRTLYHWVLSKEISSTIFKVFDMTRPGIKPIMNITPSWPMIWYFGIYIVCKQMTYVKSWLEIELFDLLTVWEQTSDV